VCCECVELEASVNALALAEHAQVLVWFETVVGGSN